MNIDARPYNKGAKHTRYHVTTPQEFSRGNGFHQIPHAAASQVNFQSHLGLHRMKGRFLGPTNSSRIFHHARGRGGQHDAVQGEGEGLVDLVKDVGAGPDQDMIEDKLAGLGDLVQDAGAGPDQNVIKDERAGPDKEMTEDERAGPDSLLPLIDDINFSRNGLSPLWITMGRRRASLTTT